VDGPITSGPPPDDHPFVAALNPEGDPGKSPVRLVGYVGSRTEETLRLYFDLNLQSYYEVPTEAVVGHAKLDPEVRESPDVLFVSPDARIQLVRVSTQSLEAAYLRGALASAYLPGTAVAADGRAAAAAVGGDVSRITAVYPYCTTNVRSCLTGAALLAAATGEEVAAITKVPPYCTTPARPCA